MQIKIYKKYYLGNSERQTWVFEISFFRKLADSNQFK